MTQARITDFGRSFSDIVTSRAQKLGCAFHSKIAQILRNSQTDFARKNPAQIERTAAHFLPNYFQRRWIGEVAREKLLRAFHAFARDAFLPHTEKFRIFWCEEKMRHELQCLALIPEDLRCFCHRRPRQARDHVALLHCHRTGGSDHVFLFVSKYDPANLRLKINFVPHQLLLLMFPPAPRRRPWFIGDRVIPTVARDVGALWATFSAYRSTSVEVQTELQAIWMEGASPVKGMLGAKIVPLNRDPDFVHVAIQGAPS